MYSRRWIERAGFALAGLALGLGGALAYGAVDDDVRASRQPADSPSSPQDAPAAEPEQAAPDLGPKDFMVRIAITSRDCFGDAGCNIEYSVDPTYVGTADLHEDGHYRVTYEVRGVDDGPAIGSFELEGDQIAFESEGAAGVPGPKSTPTAVVTAVDLLPY